MIISPYTYSTLFAFKQEWYEMKPINKNNKFYNNEKNNDNNDKNNYNEYTININQMNKITLISKYFT